MKSTGYREHWYSGITDAVGVFVPWSRNYKTIASRRARTGFLFMLPFLIGFIAFLMKPLLQSVVMSMSEISLVPGSGYDMKNVGIANFNYALRVDAGFSGSLVRSVTKMITNTLAIMVLSFVLAVIINGEFRGRLLVRAILFLPVILYSGILPDIENTTSTYKMMAGVAEEVTQSGGVNLSQGLQDLLVVSGMGAGVFDFLFRLIDSIYEIVMSSGIQIVVFLSGLQTIPQSMYEAASIEGCSAWECFWKITFPMICPLMLVNCIYTIVDCFMRNDNEVMQWIGQVMYSQGKLGPAAAMSWLYFAVAAAFIGISTLIIRKGVGMIHD